MNNTPALRSLVVVLSLITVFYLHGALLTEQAMAAGIAPDGRMTARITDLPPGITVTPSPVEFPNTPDGTISQIMVTLRNTTSTITYDLSEAELISPSFIVDLTIPQQLPPRTETQFTVYFWPIDQGYFEATLKIKAYGAGTIATIPLSGFGTPAPEINVSPSAAAFGNQTVGVPSLNPITITVMNPGSAPLSLASLSVNGGNASDFPVQGFPIAPIPAYTQTTFIVGFTPSAEGPRSASLDFSTNVSGRPTVSIALSGTGVNGPPPPSTGGSTSFTYQGKLVEAGANVSTPRDLKFKLFDDENDVQIGSDVIVPGVSFRDGIFTTVLDFGANPFTGAPRSLEISVSQPGANVFTALSPRQPITSTPYAVRSLEAVNAENATNTQQLGGIPANQYVSTVDPRMSNPRDPIPGSASYVQNQNSSPQALANFNIDGAGSANVINSQTRYNIGGSNALSFGNSNSELYVGSDSPANTGTGQTFVGRFAGYSNTTGSLNTFVGSQAGQNNQDGYQNTFIGVAAGFTNQIGYYNTFLGVSAGGDNSTGHRNTFVGEAAGHDNSTGFSNSFFGQAAGTENTTGDHVTLLGANTSTVNGLTFATAVGAGATVTSSNTVALGRTADSIWIPGNLYLNQLGPAAATRLCWNSTNYQISTCSTPLAGTSELTEFNGEQVPTVLVNALKQQQAKIDAQAKQIEQLKTLVCSMNPTADLCLTTQQKSKQ
ncbi:MAG: choice-of-anchor D domain-containing protein [Acidobacteria bacterium]|nr:choice-of-anchor D domain-containing protein [Acidobacteriota bacterium]